MNHESPSVFKQMETPADFKLWIILLICAKICLLIAGNALAQNTIEPLTGHVFYGKMAIPNNDPEIEGGDYEINVFGADVQKPLSQGKFKYGFETGAFFSIDSDVRQFGASSGSNGGTVSVAVDISSILIDYFFGGYLAFEPAKWLRLYAGAGPLLIWSRWETEPEDPTTEPFAYESESGFGAGLYARAGIDIFFTDYFGLNAGARITETTLSFEDVAGNVDVEGWQYYFGMAFHF